MNTPEDRQAVRMLVRLRDDFQAMRKRIDNRLGRKADGSEQDVDERAFRPEDLDSFTSVADVARGQEAAIEKMLLKVLKRFPVYTEFLASVKGVGPIAAGWIIAEFDIERATTVSKMWQFAGLNPGMVRGKKRHELGDGKFDIEVTDTMVRGDRKTPGFVAPFNGRLRTALVGVMADGFIKAQNHYALEYYYPLKERLANSANEVEERKGGKSQHKPWSEVSKGHRDRAAKRYMVKMFLLDLYKAWREIEGLHVRPSYQEEKLGHIHGAEPVAA